MLKEIKSEKDAITNVDLFNEIVAKVKESGNWPDSLIEYASPCNYEMTNIYNYMFDPCFILKPKDTI